MPGGCWHATIRAMTPTITPSPAPTVTTPRRVERLVTGQPTSDGAGVKLTRLLTQPLQRRLDPFLMLDAFGSDQPGDYIAGFPSHPHRGFETITYMIAGRMRHRDSAGNEGLLSNGGVQWMTAGRGVVHSELPEQEEGLMEGFQLWLNLHSADKMQPPAYHDFPAEQIPEWVDGGHGDGEHGRTTVRVIAGSSHGVQGAVQRPHTLPLYLDIHLPPGARFEQPLPASHNAFVYVYRGGLSVQAADGATEVPLQHMAILANGDNAATTANPGAKAPDGVVLQAGATPTRALLIAGAPLHEPIAQHGPFVMNTRAQLHAAVQDFQAGKLA